MSGRSRRKECSPPGLPPPPPPQCKEPSEAPTPAVNSLMAETLLVAAEHLSKTFQVKVRDPGIGGAVRALLHPRYRPVRAVRDVTFRIGPGEIVAFLGPNGAGKTTTLKMLAGLLYPTSGRVHVAGFDPWTGGPAFKRRIALVLGNRQQLVWDLPPEETYQLNRAIYDLTDADYRARLEELVTLLGLGEVRDKPVRQLSLGERMKCELVASLLHQPPLLFLDEPTLGLDVTAQEAIRRFLIEYRDRHGATVLLTSHYMQDVTALASRVLMINRGRLLYDGALEALVARSAPTKRIELVLGGGSSIDGVTRDRLAAFGEVKSFHFPNAVLEVRREDAPATSARLLAALPVADLSIEDPPIEEVIRRAFAQGVEEDEA
jgi:viologen exporter family transport system ATP-binding protein